MNGLLDNELIRHFNIHDKRITVQHKQVLFAIHVYGEQEATSIFTVIMK